MKNVNEAYETLEEVKADLEKPTLVASMESKVSMVVTTILSTIDIVQRDLERKESLDSERRIKPGSYNEHGSSRA